MSARNPVIHVLPAQSAHGWEVRIGGARWLVPVSRLFPTMDDLCRALNTDTDEMPFALRCFGERLSDDQP